MSETGAPPSTDIVRRALSADAQAIVIAVDATQIVRESMNRIEAWPPAMLHLGQAMLSTALLAALPDHAQDERIELQWRAEGPFGGLYAECRDKKNIRGTIFFPRPDVASLNEKLGPGLLQVRRLRNTATTGIVEAQGDVALDVLEYLERSEQKNCALYLWVDIKWEGEKDLRNPFLVNRALGFLVHILPQKTEAQMNRVLFQWSQHIESLGPISRWVLGPDPTADMLSFVTAELHPQIVFAERLSFFCTCSEDRAERALTILAQAEKQDTPGPAPVPENRVRCEFCGRTYLFKSD